MPKRLKIIIIFSLCIFAIIIATLFCLRYVKNYKNSNELSNKDLEITGENKNEEMTDENETENIMEYVDDNPIKIGLYVNNGNQKELVSSYYCGWDPEEVLGIFYAIFTTDEKVSGNQFNIVWKQYFDQYTDISKYRIGYNIKFTMNDGEVIDQTILNPDHAYLMYPEIQFYLYDDINLVPGKRYYHITSEEMNENTICSSVKLVGDKKTPNIISDIELTAFTYDSEDDFDPNTGKYRGNSYYTVIIKRK